VSRQGRLKHQPPKLNFEVRKYVALLLLCWGMSCYKHISKIDRLEIGILLRKDYSVSEIAAEIGRHPSSVYREIRRNAVSGSYQSTKAHHKAYVRRRNAKYQAICV
jgi:hypothetical protein